MYTESRAKDEIGNWTAANLPLDVWGLDMNWYKHMDLSLSLLRIPEVMSAAQPAAIPLSGATSAPPPAAPPGPPLP